MAKTPDQQAQFEADRTFLRTIELVRNPVAGAFDRRHLQQIHQRLFQDLPAFKPGQLRLATPDGVDWVKRRDIAGHSLLVAYSPMNQHSLRALDAALSQHSPAAFSTLPAAEVPIAMAQLYSAIDYAHPFNDGNSRTLRVFTRQLAEASGYNLNWEKIATGESAQSRLYVARDLAVNTIALPRIRSPFNRRDAQHMLDVLAQNPPLSQLLKSAMDSHQGLGSAMGQPIHRGKITPMDRRRQDNEPER